MKTLWLIEEHLRSGSICWKVVEHRLQATQEAEDIRNRTGRKVVVSELVKRVI